MKSTQNLFKRNNSDNTLKHLFQSCDATVVSKKKDTKFIFLKINQPNNITHDKLRFKGKQYIKNGHKLYHVIVDMYEHNTIISGDGDFADIWVVDSLEQAQEQLDIMIQFGAKQFSSKIKITNKEEN